MRSKRLTSEDGAIVGDGGFKAFGVNAPLWELTLLLTSPRTADAGDASQDISQSSTEDVALVSGHPQRLLDGVGEAVAGEAEVLEHSGSWVVFSMRDPAPRYWYTTIIISNYVQEVNEGGGITFSFSSELRTSPTRAASTIPAK